LIQSIFHLCNQRDSVDFKLMSLPSNTANMFEDWKIRSWNSFFEAKSFAIPVNVEEAMKRGQSNLEYYTMNYLILMALILGLTVIIYPMYLVSLLGIGAAGGFVFLNKNLAIQGKQLELQHKIVAIAIAALLLFFLTSSFMTFLSSTLVTLSVVLAHAILRKPSLKSKVANLVSGIKEDLRR